MGLYEHTLQRRTGVLVIDDILMAPASGLRFILRQIAHAADQELANEADDIRSQLSELYMRLETRQISQEEFDAEEKKLLDRLDRSESQNAGVDREPKPDR
jgi:predicted Zn-dependent peptidase